MSAVDHPPHYQADGPYEAIKVIEAWGLGFCLGNVVKYVCRLGKKVPFNASPADTLVAEIEDASKARWYLDRHIKQKEQALADLRRCAT